MAIRSAHQWMKSLSEAELDAKRQKFLAIAHEADEEAAKTSDKRNRETWLNLAVQYRVLAADLPE